MDEPSANFESVFDTESRSECREYRLVLEAVGIPAEMVHRDERWCLLVKHRDLAWATAELDAYRQENSDRLTQSQAMPLYGGAGTGVLLFAGILILVAHLSVRRAFGIEWMDLGHLHVGKMMSGQWWRTVTALTLHIDAAHLCSNLLFGAVFGFLAGRILGGGIAWLTILIAGVLGNAASAQVKSAEHISIGASTAVFAALGIVVSHALDPRLNADQKLLQRWAPLIGGLLLFAFTGIGGERTDVMSHVTGFSAGLLIGRSGRKLPERWRASDAIQQWTGIGAATIVAAAWLLAIASGSR